jgi:hypothetical protein
MLVANTEHFTIKPIRQAIRCLIEVVPEAVVEEEETVVGSVPVEVVEAIVAASVEDEEAAVAVVVLVGARQTYGSSGMLVLHNVSCLQLVC